MRLADKQTKIQKEKQAPKASQVIFCNHLNFSFNQKQVLHDVTFSVKKGDHITIVGENGAGKTTLLNQIYYGNKAIEQTPSLKFGYLQQHFENLNTQETILENIMATSIQTQVTARNILANLLFYGFDVDKKVGLLIGGERIKVSLAKLILSEVNALLLDEPNNYLDIASLEALENTLKNYPGTLLLVSHDKKFREAIADKEIFFKNKLN